MPNQKTIQQARDKADFIESCLDDAAKKGRAPDADKLKVNKRLLDAKLTRPQAGVLIKDYEAAAAGIRAEFAAWSAPEPDPEAKPEAHDAWSQVREGYANHDAARFEALIDFYDKVVKALGPFAAAPPKKQKPAADQAAKYKTAGKDPAFAFFKSLKAESVIGKSVAWVWNVRSRRLGCYVAGDSNRGLTFKDGKIAGFDAVRSVSKAGIKPNEDLKGKRDWQKAFDALGGMELPLDGKGSAQVMIVKVQ